MKLTTENYHSLAAKQVYMSASRYKDFAGTLGTIPCESRVMASLRGEWKEESTNAMKVSSFVDAHFSHNLGMFKGHNPEIFTQKGELRAEYKHAEVIIQRIERDEYFMKYLSGQKQVIMTAELWGAQWSIMMDSYIPDIAIVDLKVMADLTKAHWVKDYGHMSFVRFYGYDLQAAIYQAVVEAVTGKRLPFYIAGASKEAFPDIEIIGFDQNDIDEARARIASTMPRIISIRSGKEPPERCGTCDYCRHTKVLSKPIHHSELIERI